MTTLVLHFTRAELSHIDGFLRLQEANLVSRLPVEAHAGGFVTTPFTPAQLKYLINHEHLFVALHGEQVAGYIVCASWPYLRQYPIFEHMVSLLPEVDCFDGAVNMQNSYQYGPICIDAAHRGSGMMPALFAYARAQMQAHYPYALTFVNSRNIRSREAHLRKLGLMHIRDFDFADQHYHMLGFTTSEGSA